MKKRESKLKVPRVLQKARQVAKSFASNSSSGYTKGPWDQGHWANRK